MNTQENNPSRMLLTQVESDIAAPSEGAAVHNHAIKLGEGAQLVFDNASRDVGLIFDHAASRIAQVRHACDVAEQAVLTKRNDLERALHAYVQALQVVETATTNMQQAIGDVLVTGDGLGG